MLIAWRRVCEATFEENIPEISFLSPKNAFWAKQTLNLHGTQPSKQQLVECLGEGQGYVRCNREGQGYVR